MTTSNHTGPSPDASPGASPDDARRSNDTGTARMLDDAVEELMRRSDDASLIYDLLTSAPGSNEALTVIGRLARTCPATIDPHGPLAAYVRGGDYPDTWRDRCPVAAGSLDEQLRFAAVLHPGVPQPSSGRDRFAAWLGTAVA